MHILSEDRSHMCAYLSAYYCKKLGYWDQSHFTFCCMHVFLVLSLFFNLNARESRPEFYTVVIYSCSVCGKCRDEQTLVWRLHCFKVELGTHLLPAT